MAGFKPNFSYTGRAISTTGRKREASRIAPFLTILTLFLLAASISACSLTGSPSAPPRYYILGTGAGHLGSSEGQKAGAERSERDGCRSEMPASQLLLVGPVEIPAYLDRPNLVKRQGNRLVVSESDRWAEPLDRAIERVLAHRIGQKLCAIRAIAFSSALPRALDRAGSKKGPDTLLLSINCYGFECVEDKRVILEVEWTLARDSGGGVIAQGAKTYQVLLDHKGWTDIITAMERALAHFGNDLALILKAHLESRPEGQLPGSQT